MPGQHHDDPNWNKAKSIIEKEYPGKKGSDSDSYWSLVQHVYQNMKNGSTDRYNTRTAFINGVLYNVGLLDSGLSQVIDKLLKIDARADEMVSHLDALSADQNSSQLSMVCKKIQKALDACTFAKEAVNSMLEDISDGIVVEEEPINEQEQEETQEQQQEPTAPESTTEEQPQEGQEEIEVSEESDNNSNDEKSDEKKKNDFENDELLIEDDDKKKDEE